MSLRNSCDVELIEKEMSGVEKASLCARDIACYFLVTDQTLIHIKHNHPAQGYARLNSYLHIAQNLYIAKYGRKLFEDDLYALHNSVVVMDIMENFNTLIDKNEKPFLARQDADFLDKVMHMLENASLEELTTICHEDKEWRNKCQYNEIRNQRMDSLAHKEEYAEQYADALYVLEEAAWMEQDELNMERNQLDSMCGISDEELTRRFRESVRIDEEIRSIMGLPQARYDSDTEEAYLEYPDGRREYV